MEQGPTIGGWLNEMCLREKLAATFSENGAHHRLALEDHLLILAGHRTPRPEGKEMSQPMAQLMDKLSEFDEPKLRLVAHFADFISETGAK